MSSPFPALVCVSAILLSGLPLLRAQDIDPDSGKALPYPGTPVTGYKLAWSDEFNGAALDTAKWNYRTDTRFWSLQRAANVRVSSGSLYLDLKKETFGTTSYTGGGVISKKLFRYGYYEARMKVPPGSGWHTSFWMMKANRPATDTVAIELDAIENDSVTPLKYGVNTHRHLPTPHLTYGSKNVVTPSLNADYHVFGCEFTPTLIRYFFEGNVVQTVNATQFPHNDLNIWLTSIAAPLGGTTSVDDTQLPAAALFDYTRFFAPAATASVNVTAPGSAGVTLASTDHSLRIAANAASSDAALTPSILWSKFSGPGEVTFADPTQLTTTASFSSPGTYLLQCTATVDGNPTSARVPVAVDAPLPAMFRQSFDGYTHTATFIRGDSPEWNSGARDQIIVGRWNNLPMRLLFSYDLTGLPADATIEAATFELWTDSGGGTGTVGDLELRPLLEKPTEGTGTGTNATDGAGSGTTWLSRTGGTAIPDLWTTAGANFGPEVVSSAAGFDATFQGHPIVFPSSTTFTALAETARSTATPLKLLVLAPSTEAGTTNSISRIGSDDNLDADHRPQLTVYYRGNYAPSPSTGASLSAVAGLPTTLPGSVVHASSTNWTRRSGPAPVTFADANLASTTATFPMPGVYALELTATNNLAETSAPLAVTVVPPPSAYESWLALHFGAAPDPADAGDLADPDHDDLPNLIEFATGGDPTVPNKTSVSLTNQESVLELVYPQSHAAAADGTTFQVEWSDLLANGWSSAGVSQSAIPESDTAVARLW
ncbi:MAG: hypothetical protein RLZZ214_1261, partial [Verrucomicrobiota bacterium]